MASSSYAGTVDGQQDSKRPNVLLAASGSMDASKFGHLCVSVMQWANLNAVATQTAMMFIDKKTIPDDFLLYSDGDEFVYWTGLGAGVLHIDLQNWAEVMVIAPLSANTLAKIAGGICDNLLTSIVRAWDYKKPLFVAPAMDQLMWSNFFTEQHLLALDEKGIQLIPPDSSRNEGIRAMAGISRINDTIRMCCDNKHKQRSDC